MISGENYPTNIGNPNEMTILELAKEIIHLTDSSSRIIHKGLPTDDPKVRRPNIAKAKKILKWYPKVNLETGLKNTINYFKGVSKPRRLPKASYEVKSNI